VSKKLLGFKAADQLNVEALSARNSAQGKAGAGVTPAVSWQSLVFTAS